MKQRKANKSQPRKVAMGQNPALGGASIDNGNKLPSGHTKMSTNYTIHSSALEQARRAKKAAPRSNSKENPLSNSRKLPNSKNNKKFKINIDAAFKASLPEESYREYCLMDEGFVPVVNAGDKKRLEDMLSQTATTSCDFNSHFRAPAQPSGLPQLRKRAVSNTRHSGDQPVPTSVQRTDVATSVLKIPEPIRTSIEILAVPESAEIGLQYSARPEEKPEPVKEVRAVKEMKEEAAQVVEGESLSDLLFKLQFSHLGDEKSFTSLTSNEKEHFTQLLETLATKLRGKPQMKPIAFPTDFSDSAPSSTYSLPAAEEERHRPNLEEVERLVCLREFHQMNWMQAGEAGEDEVHTSLYSCMTFLCHLFCFVEMHYSQEFVYMIQKFYGHTYREKYRRITRGIPLLPDRKFRVVDEAVFLEFINESNAYGSPLEIAHMKAIFDAFNEHLEEYRPFFAGNGEQFPWALRMFVSMSEYSISEDSLQIIFMQAKEKMVEWCSQLCGLLVDRPAQPRPALPALPAADPLEAKRTEREDRMLHGWLREDNFEKDGIELYCTQTLHEVAELIYQQLLAEAAQGLL